MRGDRVSIIVEHLTVVFQICDRHQIGISKTFVKNGRRWSPSARGVVLMN